MSDDALFFRLADVTRNSFGIETGHIDVESLPGLQQLANDQPNSECECRNRLEVKQRFDADAADLSIIILMRAIKPSPSGLRALPRSGQKWPIKMPIAIAIRTWM
jgi:hypothetical protein